MLLGDNPNQTYRLRWNTEKEFQCEQCSKPFGRKDHLAAHIKSVHEKVKEFCCDQCMKQFVREEQLTGHLKTVHEKIET